MLEIFMFTNPIGGLCLDTEIDVIRGLKQHKQKSQINLVPIANMQVVNDYLHRNRLDTSDLILRNRVMAITYQSMLDYKAASFQGKQRARAFTMALQKYLVTGIGNYSDDLVTKIIHEVKLDEHAFRADRKSQLVKDLCDADRHLASDLEVAKTPSTVFVDYRHDPDGDGILVNGCVTEELINEILENPESAVLAINTKRPTLKVMTQNQRGSLHLI